MKMMMMNTSTAILASTAPVSLQFVGKCQAHGGIPFSSQLADAITTI
jgi:hypothetical protein